MSLAPWGGQICRSEYTPIWLKEIASKPSPHLRSFHFSPCPQRSTELPAGTFAPPAAPRGRGGKGDKGGKGGGNAGNLPRSRRFAVSQPPSSPPPTPTSRLKFGSQWVSGAAKASGSMRLFVVPGMGHCSGGAGTDQFDRRAAISQLVERGKEHEQPDLRLSLGSPSTGAPAASTIPRTSAASSSRTLARPLEATDCDCYAV